MLEIYLKLGDSYLRQELENELTLVPNDSLTSYSSLAQSLDWELPWQPWARLTLSHEGEAVVVTNETRDEAVKLNGKTLVSSPFTKADTITIGDLSIEIARPEPLQEEITELTLMAEGEGLALSRAEEREIEALDIPSLLAEIDALEQAAQRKPFRFTRPKLGERSRALLCSLGAAALFTLFFLLVSLLRLG